MRYVWGTTPVAVAVGVAVSEGVFVAVRVTVSVTFDVTVVVGVGVPVIFYGGYRMAKRNKGLLWTNYTFAFLVAGFRPERWYVYSSCVLQCRVAWCCVA